MNSNPQFDLHPDAESLNAFAELVLPEREREQVLTHLAACSRCRQVVHFAQDAASASEMNEAAAYRQEMDSAEEFGFAAAMVAAPAMPAAMGPAEDRNAGPQSGWWSRRWRIAWVPSAALAAIIGLVIFVHIRQTRLGSEAGSVVAKVAPQPEFKQSPPQQQQGAAEPPPAGKAVAAVAKPAVQFGRAMAGAKEASSTPASAPFEALSAEAAPPAPPQVATGEMETSSSEFNQVKSLQQAQRQAAAAQANAAIFNQAVPGPAAVRTDHVTSARSFDAADANAAPAMARGKVVGVQSSPSASASAVAPPAALKSESLGSFEVSAQNIADRPSGIMANRKAKTFMLPSGLSAVSIVASQQNTLAIDKLGKVFLSQDSGSHWEPVTRQWSGRAVTVRIQHDLEPNATPAEGSHAGGAQNVSHESTTDALAAPHAIFEIVNDGNLVWVSTDGKTWKAK
jgi:hypothetical protein